MGGALRSARLQQFMTLLAGYACARAVLPAPVAYREPYHIAADASHGVGLLLLARCRQHKGTAVAAALARVGSDTSRPMVVKPSVPRLRVSRKELFVAFLAVYVRPHTDRTIQGLGQHHDISGLQAWHGLPMMGSCTEFRNPKACGCSEHYEVFSGTVCSLAVF